MQMVYFLNIGTGELILIVLFVLIFFGSKSIPDFARTLGRGMREFRNASDAVKREIADSVKLADEKIQHRRSEVEQEYRRTLDQIEEENPGAGTVQRREIRPALDQPLAEAPLTEPEPRPEISKPLDQPDDESPAGESEKKSDNL